MKLAAALQIVNTNARCGPTDWTCFLACGFTPLHFRTFLYANLLQRSGTSFELDAGVFGDLFGSLRRIAHDKPAKAAVVIEWSDLDPRLGYRTTHGWRIASLDDIVATVSDRLSQLQLELRDVSGSTTVCVSLPTLPLPPIFPGSTSQGSSYIFDLHELVCHFAAELSRGSSVRIVDSERLAHRSPVSDRHDIRAELATGFPYQLRHAAVLAEEIANLLVETPRKKGIITDLDNTLWRGVVGDDGVYGVTWDLDHHSHCHAIYQETLASLAEYGVFIGIASKNDPDIVLEALQRNDIIVPTSAIFPIECSWGPKSDSVRSILDAWNIGADDVVFIDDSALELAEVSAAFPGMECIQFPFDNDRDVLELAKKLRDHFGKPVVTAEDRVRVSSVRNSWNNAREPKLSPDDFLKQVDAELTIEFNQPDARSFELINKTNQFNLNGRRLDDAQWRALCKAPDSFLIAVSYKDKFGPLGKISVVSGCRSSEVPTIDVWVMSCRAFSRRIEYQVLQILFDYLQADALQLSYVCTGRNTPVRELLRDITGTEPSEPMVVEGRKFLARCPKLFGRLVVL